MAYSRRGVLLGALRLAGGIALAACAPSAPATTGAPGAAGASATAVKRGGTLVYADWGDATTLDPAFISATPGRRPGKAIPASSPSN